MNYFRSIALLYTLAAICLLSGNQLAAQDTAQIFRRMTENLSAIDSISATVEVEKSLKPAYLQIEPSANTAIPTTFVFEYIQRGRSFTYTIDSTTPGKEGLIVRHARRNGLDQYFSRKEGGTLVLTTGPADAEWLTTDNGILAPFGFLFTDPKSPENFDYLARMPELTIFQSATWESLLKSANLGAARVGQSDGRTTAVTMESSELDEGSNRPRFTYQVTLDNEHAFYPVSFKKFNSAGVLVQELYVDGLMEIKPSTRGPEVYVPESVNHWGYNSKGETVMETSFTVMSAELNGIEGGSESESLFSIDPASAALIYDKDHDVHIRVPR